MPLVLTLHRSRDPSGQQRESRVLEAGSLSIGRGPANDWVLQDPAQHLSKTHCVVSATPAGGFVLTDRSSNGVFLNGARERMPRDGQARLRHGDEFLLGEYLVRVSEVAELTSRAVSDSATAAPRGAPLAPGGDDPFGLDEFLDAPVRPPPPAPRADPFADPVADPFAVGADPFGAPRNDPFGDGFDELLGGGGAPAARPFGEPQAPAAAARPDPFDALEPHRAAGRGGAPDPFGVEDDLLRGATPPVAWEGPSQPDTVDGAAQSFRPGRVNAPDPRAWSGQDWDDLLGDTPPGPGFAPAPASAPPAAAPPARPPAAGPPPAAPPPAAAAFGMPPDASPVQAAPPVAAQPFVAPAPPPPVAAAPVTALPAAAPPTHAAAVPAPVPPASVSPAAAPAPPGEGSADAAAILAAFLEGAGVPRLEVGGDPVAYFRGVGGLFALMIESLRDVLMSRAAVKGEFGVEQTMLRARDNNALKFSVTPQDAVAALLSPGRPGYMAPERAAREAFEDVRLHQLAVMAGVQAALFNLLRTFDPQVLEGRLQKGSMLEGVLPGARRARLWDAFCAAYRDIARDADGDFQQVFGREFARAYAEQMRAP